MIAAPSGGGGRSGSRNTSHAVEPDPTAPIDGLHAACVEARRQIRHQFDEARLRVANWQPAPPPEHP
jgi:hypothetical protein